MRLYEREMKKAELTKKALEHMLYHDIDSMLEDRFNNTTGTHAKDLLDLVELYKDAIEFCERRIDVCKQELEDDEK